MSLPVALGWEPLTQIISDTDRSEGLLTDVRPCAPKLTFVESRVGYLQLEGFRRTEQATEETLGVRYWQSYRVPFSLI